jgi:SAM-dependent methyltransferase
MTYDIMYLMAAIVKKYLDPTKKLNILDVGSLDVHNPVKKLTFGRYLDKPPLWNYTGLDLVPGRNVDVVSEEPYRYPFAEGEFDVVVSGSTLEHVFDTHRFIKELARISNDLIIVIAPNTHVEHRYPVDCWRVFPDGMTFLLGEIAELNIIDVYRGGGKEQSSTVGIAKKLNIK